MLGWLRPHFPKVLENTFVVWEPCSKSHGEIIPGYAKYLLDLGYEVLVLMTPDRIDEGLFARMSNPKLTLAKLSQRQIRRFLKTPDIHDAAGILITTAGKLSRDADHRTDLDIVFNGRPPENVFLVEHDAAPLLDNKIWDSNLITLRELTGQSAPSVVVNPHYFGEVKFTPKNQSKTCFTMVGAARAKRRNDNLVLNAAEKLVASGITDFEIRLVGKKGTLHIPDVLTPYITEVGRVNFQELYTEIENSDFILTAFQAENPDHSFYRTTGTSGSFQLSYGFGKPCIVQQKFAVGTALTDKNSLAYDTDTQMYDALKQAIETSMEDYQTMQNALITSSDQLAAKSLSNLKALIDD